MTGLALAGATGFAAAAGDTVQGAVATLRRSGEVMCQPALPVFCYNIHVSCSGPTTTPAFPFTLRAARDDGSIESSADTSGIAADYQRGRVEWDDEGAYVILRPQHAAGYIKVLADGSYSFRHYTPSGGTMSRGQCHSGGVVR